MHERRDESTQTDKLVNTLILFTFIGVRKKLLFSYNEIITRGDAANKRRIKIN